MFSSKDKKKLSGIIGILIFIYYNFYFSTGNPYLYDLVSHNYAFSIQRMKLLTFKNIAIIGTIIIYLDSINVFNR